MFNYETSFTDMWHICNFGFVDPSHRHWDTKQMLLEYWFGCGMGCKDCFCWESHAREKFIPSFSDMIYC